MSGLLGTKKLSQVGFIVKDIEKSKKAFAEFLGIDAPDTIDGGDYAITQTTVNGKPAPDANCLMAFFNLDNGVQIELIEPNGVKSTWQDFLDEHGEGIHHIAFTVNGTEKVIKTCEAFGMNCVQRGKYGNASGEYTYLDATDKLHCIIELLESY